MSLDQLPDIPTVPEVSAATGIPEATLRWYRSVDIGPKSFRVGRRIRYRKADVVAWFEAQEQNRVRGGVR